MEINEFVKLIKEQYYDADSIEMSAQTDIRSIESFDSLTGMAILVEIKDATGVELTDDEWKSLHTVEEIYNYVISKKA
jgi:acyl carrier protein